MDLPFSLPLAPMEAETAAELPPPGAWRYEPKWDGFRCLAFKSGSEVVLQSKAGKPLGRYFPEVAAAVAALRPRVCALDGELVVPDAGGFSFDALLQRIHPAASRVERLAEETPARYLVFDLLAAGAKTSLLAQPLERRRRRLESFAERYFEGTDRFELSPATGDREVARRWLAGEVVGLDGVIAKRCGEPYRMGERAGMVKVKTLRSADCVVGGYRTASSGDGLGSLLLGLYDDDGLLHHVGYCSSFTADERRALGELVAGVAAGSEGQDGPSGFTGKAPGGPSRWSTERSAAWVPLPPELVVEVRYDHVTGRRFRHGTKLLRRRPDKAPRQCTFEQLAGGG